VPRLPEKDQTTALELQDPSLATGTEDEQLQVFQRVRDQIKRRLSDWIETQ
jgi:protein-tyrosine-phosphatase